MRRYDLSEFSAEPVKSVDLTAWGVAASAFIPVIPGRADKRGNSLSVTGEYVYGYGVADEYTGLTGGVANAGLPNPMMKMPAPVYTPNIDAGMVAYTADGVAHLIQWQTFIVGLQYTFPGLDGKMWISSNYSRSNSDNAFSLFGASGKVRTGEDFVDVSLFGDITPAVRFGAEYAYFNDHYGAGDTAALPAVDAINHRFQFSAFYIF
jgi:hypothetical protein